MLWAGAGTDTVPFDFFGGLITQVDPLDVPHGWSPSCTDVEFIPGGVKSRPGTTAFPHFPSATAGVTSIYGYIRPDGATRMLTLDDSGNVQEETVEDTTFVTVASGLPVALLMNAVTLFGRAFLGFSDGKTGQFSSQWFDDGVIYGDSPAKMRQIGQDGPGILYDPAVGLRTHAQHSSYDDTQTTTITAIGGGGGSNRVIHVSQWGSNDTDPYTNGQTVNITGIVGPTDLNNQWVILNVDVANHHFEVPYTLSGAWVSGGTVTNIDGQNPEAGARQFTLFYETKSGFLTSAMPPVPFGTTGNNGVSFYTLPYPPANVVKVILAITPVGGADFYYVPGSWMEWKLQTGVVPNNGAFSITDGGRNATAPNVNVTWTDDILLGGVHVNDPNPGGLNVFNRVVLPAQAAFCSYKDRLVGWGERTNLNFLFENLSFDGGCLNTAGTIAPSGWIRDTVGGHDAGWVVEDAGLWAGASGPNVLTILEAGSAGAKRGFLQQPANSALIPNITYGVRVRAAIETGFTGELDLWFDGTNISNVAITGIAGVLGGQRVVSAAGHTFVNGQRVNISGVVGAVSANGSWIISNVVAGVSFAIADTTNDGYTSGGTAGGGDASGIAIPASSLATSFKTISGIILPAQTFIPVDAVFKIGVTVASNSTKKVIIDSIELYDVNNPTAVTQLRVSEVDDPEAFDGVHGLVSVNPDDGQAIRACFVLGNTLYIAKERSLYATTDTGDEPDQWPVEQISDIVGTPSIRGVALGERWAVILSRSGLYYTEGAKPEKLSQEIEPSWESIQWQDAAGAWIVADHERKLIYAGVPTASSVTSAASFTPSAFHIWTQGVPGSWPQPGDHSWWANPFHDVGVNFGPYTNGCVGNSFNYIWDYEMAVAGVQFGDTPGPGYIAGVQPSNANKPILTQPGDSYCQNAHYHSPDDGFDFTVPVRMPGGPPPPPPPATNHTLLRARSNNVAFLTTNYNHGLLSGDTFSVTGLGGTGYNSPPNYVVLDVVSPQSFTYANTGGNENMTSDTGGTITFISHGGGGGGGGSGGGGGGVGGATPDTIFVLDYTDGFGDPFQGEGVGRKWCPWNFAARDCRLVERNATGTRRTLFALASLSTNAVHLSYLNDFAHTDYDVYYGTKPINAYYSTSFGSARKVYPQLPGITGRELFIGVVMRVRGQGALALVGKLQDGSTIPIRVLILGQSSDLKKNDFERLFSKKTERISIQFGTSGMTRDYFEISKFALVARPDPWAPYHGKTGGDPGGQGLNQ